MVEENSRNEWGAQKGQKKNRQYGRRKHRHIAWKVNEFLCESDDSYTTWYFCLKIKNKIPHLKRNSQGGKIKKKKKRK